MRQVRITGLPVLVEGRKYSVPVSAWRQWNGTWQAMDVFVELDALDTASVVAGIQAARPGDEVVWDVN